MTKKFTTKICSEHEGELKYEGRTLPEFNIVRSRRVKDAIL